MYLDLIKNASLLIALANIYSLLARTNLDGRRWKKMLMGVLFGAGAIVGMLIPFGYAPGVFYDGRSIILTLAGLFGGGTTAAVSILIAGAYRASLGGNGVWAGLATIISCAMVGFAFRRASSNHPEKYSLPMLFAIGVAAHIAMLASQLFVKPWPIGFSIIGQIWLPVMLIFPAATLLIGLLYKNEDRRIQTERKLTSSEALYHELVETAQNLIWQCDTEGRYTYLNPAWEKVFGYKTEEMLGKNFSDFQPPEYASRDLEVFTQLLQGDTLKALETVHLGKNGKEIHLLFFANTLVDDAGNQTGSRGTAYDITERKQAEIALHGLAARQKALLAAIPEIIMETDANKIYTWANQSGLDFFGEDVIGKEAAVYFEGEQTTYTMVQPLFNGTSDNVYVESWQRRKDGQKRLLAWWCHVLKDEKGQVTGALSSARDITEQHQDKQELHMLNAELEQRVSERTAELEAFAYSVSHDLKAPLRGIDGYSHLLLDDYADKLDEEGRFFLHTIRQATRQMTQLIDDLLEYSRMQRRQLSIGTVNVGQLVKAIITERALEIEAQNITIEVEVPSIDVTAEVEGLAQVLRNLLDNAMKFSRGVPSPHIEIGGESNEKTCILWIRDNGVGFDPKYQDRIFEIFQRLNHSEEYPGTGIGLAIVRKSMKRMNGRVWAEGKPGEGAVFYIEMPKAQVEKKGSSSHETKGMMHDKK